MIRSSQSRFHLRWTAALLLMAAAGCTPSSPGASDSLSTTGTAAQPTVSPAGTTGAADSATRTAASPSDTTSAAGSSSARASAAALPSASAASPATRPARPAAAGRETGNVARDTTGRILGRDRSLEPNLRDPRRRLPPPATDTARKP